MPAGTNPEVIAWSSLPRDEPMAGIGRRRVIGEKSMVARIELAKGTIVPTHHHESEQIVMVVAGTMRFGVGANDAPDRREVTVRTGEVLVFPSNMPHSAEALEDSVVVDVFTPPSERTGVDGT